jgi:hypothetical protein
MGGFFESGGLFVSLNFVTLKAQCIHEERLMTKKLAGTGNDLTAANKAEQETTDS